MKLNILRKLKLTLMVYLLMACSGPADCFGYSLDQMELVEEVKGYNRLVGLVKDKGYYEYVQYEVAENHYYTLTNLLDVHSVNPYVSAIDELNGGYYFTSKKDGIEHIYHLGLESGETIGVYPFDEPILAMSYDLYSDSLFVLSNKFGRLIKTYRLNPYDGSKELLKSTKLRINLAEHKTFLHPERDNIWVVGAVKRDHILFEVIPSTGALNGIFAANIKKNKFRVHNYNTMTAEMVLFALGKKNTILIAGFNHRLKIGFCANVSIDNKNLRTLIAGINQKLELQGTGGLKDFEIWIASSKEEENNPSYEKAQELAQNLKEAYQVSTITQESYFSVKPYGIFLSADGVLIR